MSSKRARTTGPVNLSGGSYNYLADAADRFNKSQEFLRNPNPINPAATGTVLCVCDTALTIGQPVGVESTEFQDVSDEGAFIVREHSKAEPTLSATDHRMTSWGVVVHPTKAGMVETLVRMWGIVSVKVLVDDENATHVDIDASNQLKAMFFGRGRILWKEEGTGQKWAKVMLGDGCEIVHGVAILAINSGTEGAIVVYRWNHVGTSHTVVISNDSGQPVAAGAWVSAVWCDNDRKWRPIRDIQNHLCTPRGWTSGDLPVDREIIDGKDYDFVKMPGFIAAQQQKIVHYSIGVSPTRCTNFATWAADTGDLCSNLASAANYDESQIQIITHTAHDSPADPAAQCRWDTLCGLLSTLPGGAASDPPKVLTNNCMFEELVTTWQCEGSWTTGDLSAKVDDSEDTHIYIPTDGFNRTVRQKLVHDPMPASPAKCGDLLLWVDDTAGGTNCAELQSLLASSLLCPYPPTPDPDRILLPVKFTCLSTHLYVEVMLDPTTWDNWDPLKLQALFHKPITEGTGPFCNGAGLFVWVDKDDCIETTPGD